MSATEGVKDTEISAREKENVTCSATGAVGRIEETTDNRMTPTLLTFLGLVIMFGPIQATMYSVALPEVQDDLDCTDTELGLTMSIFIFAAAIFPLMSGPVADRVGRRPVMIVGLVFFAAGSTCCALSQDAFQMIGSRLVQGVGFAICSVLPITVISDLVPPTKKGRYVSYLYMFIFTGPSIGPLLGGFITEYLNWRWTFHILCIQSVLLLISVPIVMPETLPNKEDASKRKRVSPIESLRKLTNPSVFPPVLSASMSFGALWVQIYVTPILLDKDFGLSPSIVGICMLARPLGSTSAQIFLTHFIDNADPLHVHIIATIGGVVSMALFGAAFSIHLSAVLIMMTSFGFCGSVALSSVDTFLIKNWPHKAASTLSANKFSTKFWAAILVVAVSPIGSELVIMLSTAGTLALGVLPLLVRRYRNETTAVTTPSVPENTPDGHEKDIEMPDRNA